MSLNNTGGYLDEILNDIQNINKAKKIFEKDIKDILATSKFECLYLDYSVTITLLDTYSIYIPISTIK